MSAHTEWAAAVARFTEGYGDPPDFTDEEDVAAFAPLFRDEVERAVVAELTEGFKMIGAKRRQGGE